MTFDIDAPKKPYIHYSKNIIEYALAQIVAYLPLVEQVRSSIPGGVVNFHLKMFNFEARRGGDVWPTLFNR